MQNDFGVGLADEAMPFGLEFGPQFSKVVNLAIEDDAEGLVLVEHGLIARDEVDHGQAPVTKPNSGCKIEAVAIGTPVSDGVAHRANQRAAGCAFALQVKTACDAAHARPLSSVRWRRRCETAIGSRKPVRKIAE